MLDLSRASLSLTPDLVGISLSTSVSPALHPANNRQRFLRHFNCSGLHHDLAVGQELVVNDITDKILNVDSNILDIGNPNQPLADIYIWRSRDDGTRYSRYLVANYTPLTGERLVVESSPTPF